MASATAGTAYHELVAETRRQMERWGIPGVAIGVLQDGQRWTTGLGTRDLDTGDPATAETAFRVGSISKPFAATLAMTLVNDGRLDLDTPVAVYLPELQLADPAARTTITTRHLLTHVSGLDCELGADLHAFGSGEDALDKLIAEYPRLRQWTSPGEIWSYCNTGYWLAGAVCARIAGMSFEDAMRERVFEPLGLDRTCFFPDEATGGPLAFGHNLVSPGSNEHRQAGTPVFPRCRVPSGGVISTVDNLLTFAQFHLSDGIVEGRTVIRQPLLEEMRRPQVVVGSASDHWGLGWAIRTVAGETVIGHGGSFGGFEAALSIVPDQRFAISILTNSGHGSVGHARILAWALERFCGLERPEPSVIQLSTAQLERVAGAYGASNGRVEVEVHDGGLLLTPYYTEDGVEVTYPPAHYRPLSERDFVVTDDDESWGARVAFFLNEDGSTRFMRYGGRLIDRLS